MINSKRMRWAEHVACMGRETMCIQDLFGKPEGRTSLGRPKSKWEDIIEMDLQEIFGVLDWIFLA
jgi:hypothetical protein